MDGRSCARETHGGLWRGPDSVRLHSSIRAVLVDAARCEGTVSLSSSSPSEASHNMHSGSCLTPHPSVLPTAVSPAGRSPFRATVVSRAVVLKIT
jgi:hypothetical protein